MALHLYVYPHVVLVQQVPVENEEGNQISSAWGEDTSNKSPSANDKGTGPEDGAPRESQTSPISNDDGSNASDEQHESEHGTPPPSGESDPSEEDIIRQRLSVRAYHLPGNGWCEDWQMYIKNNHLVFGLCCHHRLHPVKKQHRLILLLGSMTFGLMVTNMVYFWGDVFRDATALSWSDKIYNETISPALSWSDKIYNETIGGEINIAGQSWKVVDTSHMGLLWTLGSGVHSIFDFVLWHLIACGHCHHKRWKTTGWTLAVIAVTITVSITGVLVYFRALRPGEEDTDQQNSIADKNIGMYTAMNYASDEADFLFLVGYLVELSISLFVYTPLVQTMMFSGIVGCGCFRIPLLGGRPLAMRNEKKMVADV